MARVAVLGGTFDPPHLAHIEIANNAIAEFGYRRLIILPSYNPPHKTAVCTSKHRLDMVKLAFKGNQVEICDIEMNGDGFGYTVNTIPKLLKLIGEPFDFIIGGDSLRDFDKWYRWQEILKLVKIVVAVRDDNYDTINTAINKYSQLANMGIEVMKYKPMSISSSAIRLMRQLGRDISQYVSPDVLHYIEQNNLYADYDNYLDKLKSTLSAERYEHTLSTVECAISLGNKLGLSQEKVFLAALLHDCAKFDMDYSHLAIPQDSLNTPVAHAFAGAEVARADYGVTDTDILNAIYYHCTGKPDMTALEKVVFVADMLEKTRVFEGVERLRELVNNNFDQGFRQCIIETYNHVIGKTDNIYPLTSQAYIYYKDEH